MISEKKSVSQSRVSKLRPLYLVASAVSLLWVFIYYPLVFLSGARQENNKTFSSALSGSPSNQKSLYTDIYLKALETNLAGNWSQKYTSEPHLPGTNYGFVEWTASKFEEYGLSSEIDTYEIYVSYPNEHSLKLLTSNDSSLVYEAPLTEDVLEEDSTTQGDDLVPTFLAYAANGNVTGEYVYCNYGTKSDFETLKENGVDVSGKILIVRYGAIFRGLKVKFAQENGAIGVLIYSDPGDDNGITPENGYEVYPNGPLRNPSSVQRGSVQFLSSGVGDPTTPGYASKPGVERKDPSNLIGKIPVLPISYKEVKPILLKLNGHGEKSAKLGGKSWVGELSGYDYSIGPNPGYELNLYSDQIYNITPLWNVYGTIEGKNPNEVVIIGNHRDLWIKGGAGDPNSGSAVLLEIARGLNELLKIGWQPERTIMFASWDGEEYLLLGSTEFGENYSEQLKEKVVAYLNLDVAVLGPNLQMAGSPPLHNLMRSTLKKLNHPTGGSLYDNFVKISKDKIGDLGSGSDYTVFLDHLGIPSADFTFASNKTSPVYQYHSNYDSFHWMSTYADPGFVYHNLMAQYLGLALIELADRKLIDFKVQDYATKLETYFNSSLTQVPQDWLIEAGKISKLVSKIHQELQELKSVSISFDTEVEQLQKLYDDSDSLHWWQKLKLSALIKSHNHKLKYLDRAFIHKGGLKNRSWFKHIVYASGRYTGYEGQQFPGLIEAIEDKDLKGTAHWLGIILGALKRVRHTLQ